jgi:hypothetical protein
VDGVADAQPGRSQASRGEHRRRQQHRVLAGRPEPRHVPPRVPPEQHDEEAHQRSRADADEQDVGASGLVPDAPEDEQVPLLDHLAVADDLLAALDPHHHWLDPLGGVALAQRRLREVEHQGGLYHRDGDVIDGGELRVGDLRGQPRGRAVDVRARTVDVADAPHVEERPIALRDATPHAPRHDPAPSRRGQAAAILDDEAGHPVVREIDEIVFQRRSEPRLHQRGEVGLADVNPKPRLEGRPLRQQARRLGVVPMAAVQAADARVGERAPHQGEGIPDAGGRVLRRSLVPVEDGQLGRGGGVTLFSRLLLVHHVVVARGLEVADGRGPQRVVARHALREGSRREHQGRTGGDGRDEDGREERAGSTGCGATLDDARQEPWRGLRRVVGGHWRGALHPGS